MFRRDSLLAISSLVTLSAGCLNRGVGGQPENVPLQVENRTARQRSLTIECTEESTSAVLLSEVVELGPSDERRFEMGPIDSQSRYSVSYELETASDEKSISGSGLRAIDVEIREDGNVEVSATVT